MGGNLVPPSADVSNGGGDRAAAAAASSTWVTARPRTITSGPRHGLLGRGRPGLIVRWGAAGMISGTHGGPARTGSVFRLVTFRCREHCIRGHPLLERNLHAAGRTCGGGGRRS